MIKKSIRSSILNTWMLLTSCAAVFFSSAAQRLSDDLQVFGSVINWHTMFNAMNVITPHPTPTHPNRPSHVSCVASHMCSVQWMYESESWRPPAAVDWGTTRKQHTPGYLCHLWLWWKGKRSVVCVGSKVLKSFEVSTISLGAKLCGCGWICLAVKDFTGSRIDPWVAWWSLFMLKHSWLLHLASCMHVLHVSSNYQWNCSRNMQIPRFKIRSTVELRTAPEGPGVSSDALKHLHGSVYSGFLIRLWCAARAETQHTLVECDSNSCDLEIIHPRIDIDGKSIGINSFCEILFFYFDQN